MATSFDLTPQTNIDRESSKVHTQQVSPTVQHRSHTSSTRMDNLMESDLPHRRVQQTTLHINVAAIWTEPSEEGGFKTPLLPTSTTNHRLTSSSSPSYSPSSSISSPSSPLASLAPFSWSARAWFDPRSVNYLYLCSFLLLIGWVGNNIGWMYVSLYFGPVYAFFQTQSTALLFVLMQAPIVGWRIFRTKTITSEMRATVRWRVYAIMGLFDALYNILTSMASPYTSGPVSCDTTRTYTRETGGRET